MFRRALVLGLILPIVLYGIKIIIWGFSNIKLANFKPVAAIYLLDVSASNRTLIDKQSNTILKISKRLDSEDTALIYIVSENTYNVYDGNPHKLVAIREAIRKRGAYDSKAYGTAYGLAIKKAVGDALRYQAQGYTPLIVVLGDLENEGDITKQINWNTLPKNIRKTLQYIPDLKLVFLYAHPEKLDEVRQLLLPVFAEKSNNLIVASEENVEQSTKKLLEVLGR